MYQYPLLLGLEREISWSFLTLIVDYSDAGLKIVIVISFSIFLPLNCESTVKLGSTSPHIQRPSRSVLVYSISSILTCSILNQCENKAINLDQGTPRLDLQSLIHLASTSGLDSTLDSPIISPRRYIFNFPNDQHPLNHPPEHTVFTIKEFGWGACDEELGISESWFTRRGGGGDRRFSRLVG